MSRCLRSCRGSNPYAKPSKTFSDCAAHTAISFRVTSFTPTTAGWWCRRNASPSPPGCAPHWPAWGPDILPRAFKYMSESEVTAWVLSWATYNEVASRHDGYQVL